MKDKTPREEWAINKAQMLNVQEEGSKPNSSISSNSKMGSKSEPKVG